MKFINTSLAILSSRADRQQVGTSNACCSFSKFNRIDLILTSCKFNIKMYKSYLLVVHKCEVNLVSQLSCAPLTIRSLLIRLTKVVMGPAIGLSGTLPVILSRSSKAVVTPGVHHKALVIQKSMGTGRSQNVESGRRRTYATPYQVPRWRPDDHKISNAFQ